MRRDSFEHIVRAAGAILDESEVIVIGSQSILASVVQSWSAAWQASHARPSCTLG